MGRVVVDLAGQRFGRLLVIARAASDLKGGSRWFCLCSCGIQRVIAAHNLKRGHTKSCGCLQKQAAELRAVHSMHGTPTYRSWQAMKTRCNCRSYKNYGGRGVTYDPVWESFEQFYSDMGERPEGMTLDRVDSSGHYSAENCRWASWKEQGRNRRNNVLLEYQGEVRNLSEWSEITGISYQTLYTRLKANYPPERAIEKEARRGVAPC